jgi:hypothetical protein
LLLAVPPAAGVSAGDLVDTGIFEILQRPLVSAELAAALTRCVRSPLTLQT